MPRCKGKTRSRGGKRCKRSAKAGRDFCRVHGGNTKAGADHHNFGDGRYGRYFNRGVGKLAETYDSLRTDPDLMEMHDEMAVMQTRMAGLVEELGAENPSDALAQLRRLRTDVINAQNEGAKAEAARGMDNILKVIAEGGSPDGTWLRITDTIEGIRRISSSDSQRRSKMDGMVPVENLMFLVATVARLVSEIVSTETERLALGLRLSELVDQRTIEGSTSRSED